MLPHADVDVVALTQALISIDTAGRDEGVAMDLVASWLQPAGFELTWVPWRQGRPNLIATWRGGGPLTLAAHLDTVPYDVDGWTVDPLGAAITDGRLHGRGSSDMKAGAAAMVHAALHAARDDAGPFTLVFTSAEEVGCLGARAVASAGLLHPSPILIVGEATDNRVRYGHKGATWLEVTAVGRAAHGSRPDLGVNAIDRLADAIVALRDLEPGPPHPALGTRTVNVGTIAGGQQTNLVPARASMSIDVRTVPGRTAAAVESIARRSGEVTQILSVPSIWTAPDAEIARRVSAAATAVTGHADTPEGVTYFTDGAVLADHRAPTVFIVGPGGIDQPHTADESVELARIEQATAIYRRIIADLT